MNYLITGGTGFLGSYICKQLLDEGHNVVCYDYSINQNSIQQVLTEEEIEKVTMVQGDVRDFISLLHTCQENKIECIIHTAGLLLTDSEKNIPAAVEINIIGTVNVFEIARSCGIKRIIWSSSISAVGAKESFKEEVLSIDAPHFPDTIYGKFKDFNEFLGKLYNEKYGLETIGLRYVVIYGKSRMRGSANWINALMIDPALGIPSEAGAGEDSPNLIYVKDAARATILATKMKWAGRHAYNITGDIKSMTEIRDFILTIFPDADIKLLPGYQNVVWKFDTTPEQEEMGYIPEYTIEKGAIETINLVRKDAGLPLVQVNTGK